MAAVTDSFQAAPQNFQKIGRLFWTKSLYLKIRQNSIGAS
jgi:hypothetical protein